MSQQAPNGLVLCENILSQEAHDALVATLSSIPADKWKSMAGEDRKGSADLGALSRGRKVLQYGASFNYRTRSLDVAGVFPAWLKQLVHDVMPRKNGQLEFVPDQCTINFFEPGHQMRIPPHVDSALFGDKIVCINVGASGVVTFKPRPNYWITTGPVRYPSVESLLSARPASSSYRLIVPSNSLYSMEDEARWAYTHEMEPLVVDDVGDHPRFSITLRTIFKDSAPVAE